jgi:ribosomal protein S18 acetylase RimI-like enzyme
LASLVDPASPDPNGHPRVPKRERASKNECTDPPQHWSVNDHAFNGGVQAPAAVPGRWITEHLSQELGGCPFDLEPPLEVYDIAIQRRYHLRMIRKLDRTELDLFMAHAELQARESGNGATVRFSLRGPQDPFDRDRIRRFLENGLSCAIDAPGWCRVWIAEGPPEIRGHVGLRAHAQPESKHRALVSIGVLEAYRRQGIARELLDAAIRWARSQDTMTWLDAEVFGHNEPALQLHRKLGFTEVGRVADMFRLEGAPVDDVRLTLGLRHS